MEKIYLALVSTPGWFAAAVRKVIEQDYIHVTLSLEPEFTEAFTFGRRVPSIPFFAGFTREEADAILHKFPEAKYRIVSLPCFSAQKQAMKEELAQYYSQRFRYHYGMLSLPFVMANRPFYQKNHFTCSSFMAFFLEKHGILRFNKHFSLVTPVDFYNLPNTTLIFEGRFKDYIAAENRASEVRLLHEA